MLCERRLQPDAEVELELPGRKGEGKTDNRGNGRPAYLVVWTTYYYGRSYLQADVAQGGSRVTCDDVAELSYETAFEFAPLGVPARHHSGAGEESAEEVMGQADSHDALPLAGKADEARDIPSMVVVLSHLRGSLRFGGHAEHIPESNLGGRDEGFRY